MKAYGAEFFGMRMARSKHMDRIAYIIDKSRRITKLVATQSETLALVKKKLTTALRTVPDKGHSE